MTHPYRVTRLAAAWIAVIGLTASVSGQTPPPTALTLQAAIDRALVSNPAIAAARARRAVGTAGIAVARERLNPEARIELERETPTQAYGLAVPLELGGRRDRRIAVGEAALETAEAEIAQTIAEVRGQVRRAYFDRLIAELRLAQTGELRMLAARLRDTAQQRFDAGDAPRLEVLQAELSLAEADNQAVAAQARTEAARVALNAVLGLPLTTAIALATSIDEAAAPDGETALARARTANTALAVLDRRLAEQRARIALARSLQTPDVTPEATITRGAEPEFSTGWRAAIGITVPLMTRHRAGVLLEEATLAQLTIERDAILARVTGEVTSAAVIAEAGRQQYLRYQQQIVPRAIEVERLAEDAYRLGETGIGPYLLALQTSRDIRLRALDAASEFQNALTDLEQAVGVPLP